MKSAGFLKNNDAVSVSIGFILMFGVTVIIFCAVIISFYSLSQQAEKNAMSESFKIMGTGLSIRITVFDSIINITKSYGGTINSLEYEFSIPGSIASKGYSLNVTNSSYEIVLESENGARTVIPFNSTTNLIERKIFSGAEDYKLEYDKIANSISIKQI